MYAPLPIRAKRLFSIGPDGSIRTFLQNICIRLRAIMFTNWERSRKKNFNFLSPKILVSQKIQARTVW